MENLSNATCFDEGRKICQHDEEECRANLIESCARVHAPSQMSFVRFLTCFEGPSSSSAKACASSAGIDPSALNECADGAEGARLDMESARATARFGDGRLGTPWIVVNGKHLDDPSELLRAVCDAYEGPDVPKGC